MTLNVFLLTNLLFILENFLVEEQKGEWFFIPEETIPEINIEQNELEDGSEVSIGESQDEATQNTAPETFIDGGDDENSIPPGVRNIDEDASDPQLCSEYAQDIMRTLFEGEVSFNFQLVQHIVYKYQFPLINIEKFSG